MKARSVQATVKIGDSWTLTLPVIWFEKLPQEKEMQIFNHWAGERMGLHGGDNEKIETQDLSFLNDPVPQGRRYRR